MFFYLYPCICVGTDWKKLKMWIQIMRDVLGTDQRVDTDQGPGIDLNSTVLVCQFVMCQF